MKEVVQGLGGKRNVGAGGINMGYEDFKRIETSMVKVEDFITCQRQEEWRRKRRELRKKQETDDKIMDGDEYLMMIREQLKEESQMIRSIAHTVMNYFEVNP